MKSINFLDEDSHTREFFKEQIAVLEVISETNKEVTLLRNFLHVCTPGMASFDPSNSGSDTFESWKNLNGMIEGGAVGVFHTHPPGHNAFSEQDIVAQNGLAKAFGSKLLWHGIQHWTHRTFYSTEVSFFACVWMEHGRVFRHNYGHVNDNLNNPVIVLPMPAKVEWNNGAYSI